MTQMALDVAPCRRSQSAKPPGPFPSSASPISMSHPSRSAHSLAGATCPLARPPLVAQHTHVDRVHVPAVAVGVLAQPALLDEAAGAIRPDGALVVGVDPQPHPAQVAQPEGVVQQQPDRLPPVAAPPVILLADADAQLGGAGRLVEVGEPAAPDE